MLVPAPPPSCSVRKSLSQPVAGQFRQPLADDFDEVSIPRRTSACSSCLSRKSRAVPAVPSTIARKSRQWPRAPRSRAGVCRNITADGEIQFEHFGVGEARRLIAALQNGRFDCLDCGGNGGGFGCVQIVVHAAAMSRTHLPAECGTVNFPWSRIPTLVIALRLGIG